jgi:hypothetical protein
VSGIESNFTLFCAFRHDELVTSPLRLAHPEHQHSVEICSLDVQSRCPTQDRSSNKSDSLVCDPAQPHPSAHASGWPHISVWWCMKLQTPPLARPPLSMDFANRAGLDAPALVHRSGSSQQLAPPPSVLPPQLRHVRAPSWSAVSINGPTTPQAPQSAPFGTRRWAEESLRYGLHQAKLLSRCGLSMSVKARPAQAHRRHPLLSPSQPNCPAASFPAVRCNTRF